MGEQLENPMEKVFDPLRKKMLLLTPEEGVRQWFIKVLMEDALVPKVKMMSEVGMKFGEEIGAVSGAKTKLYRADIVVFARSGKPVMVVECKRPEVELDEDVIGQAMRYNMVLNVKYLAVTNGNKTFLFQRGQQGFENIKTLPKYSEMADY